VNGASVAVLYLVEEWNTKRIVVPNERRETVRSWINPF
jgi:hypothetical protein